MAQVVDDPTSDGAGWRGRRLAGAARPGAAGLDALHRPGGRARRRLLDRDDRRRALPGLHLRDRRSPTPATPIRGSRPRSPSRRARSSTPSRTSSTTSPGWSCTSGCRAPSRAWSTERRPGSSCRTRGRRRSRRRSSSPSTPPDGRGSSPSAVASTAAPTARCRSPARASSTAATTSRCWRRALRAVPVPAAQPDRACRRGGRGLQPGRASRSSSPRSSIPRTWPRFIVEPILGEGGYVVPPDRLPARAARDRRPPRHPAHRRRGADRRRPHRPHVGQRVERRAARHPGHGQGHRLGHAAVRDHGPPRPAGPIQPGLPRRHVRRQRGRLRGGAGHARRDRRRGPARERRAPGRAAARRTCDGWPASTATVAEVRGRGLMVGIEFAEGESLTPRPDLAKGLHPGGVRAQAAAALAAAPTGRWCASSRRWSRPTPRSTRPSAPSRSRWQPSAPEPASALRRRLGREPAVARAVPDERLAASSKPAATISPTNMVWSPPGCCATRRQSK